MAEIGGEGGRQRETVAERERGVRGGETTERQWQRKRKNLAEKESQRGTDTPTGKRKRPWECFNIYADLHVKQNAQKKSS